MGTAREWPKLSEHPLDFHYIPSAMGHLPEIGLGLALARPDREIVVLNGDGSQLMSLGALVTIAACQARNLTLVIADNGVYEVTGGQRTPASGQVDFAGLAQAAGFATAARFDDLETWRQAVSTILAKPGPRLVQLAVAPVFEDYILHVPKHSPMPERIDRFRQALGGSR